MLRNTLAAALRNLVRNRLYAAINIVGLAVGFAAALLIAVYARDEFGYDTWIPGHERIYGLSAVYAYNGGPYANRQIDTVVSHLATWLREEAPQVAAVGRLAPIPKGLPGMPLRHDDVEALDNAFYWGDASFFDAVPLPVIAGDPKTTLQRPDGLVLTRETARQFFGRDVPIGETLLVDGIHPMTVGAIIETLPPNSHLSIDVIASGAAPFSELAKFDGDPNPRAGSAYTYVQLALGASPADLAESISKIIDRHTPTTPDGRKTSDIYRVSVRAISAIHLSPGDLSLMKPRGDRATLLAMILVGGLIVVVAGLNFVGLTTARSATRAMEVAVRKTCGAQWRQLVAQFLGETIAATAVSCLLAVVAANLLSPSFAALVGRTLPLIGFWSPRAVAAGAAFVIGIAFMAGSYPAFVLAAFRPAITLRGVAHGSGAARLRQVFVVFQFAVLIALVLATLAIHRQVMFGEDQAMRFDKSQVLLIDTPCSGRFPEAVRRLPGVQDARCSGWMLSGQDIALTYAPVSPSDGTPFVVALMDAAPGLFELYGIKPTAGRLFSATDTKALIVNEAAVRHIGYSSDAAAIGELPIGKEGGPVIGVIPDVLMRSTRDAVRPTIYAVSIGQQPYSVLNVKLRGGQVPETLAAIDAAWRAAGDRPGPISRRFFDQYVQSLYIDTTRQEQLFGIFAGVAIFLASLGLFGLAAFTAERRTKEIGIRKAMGASNANILALILTEFAKPVLWANVIAWPAGYLVMHRWLGGFAYHVDLAPWMFASASALALVIAIMTVLGHALLVTSSQPVAALRYE